MGAFEHVVRHGPSPPGVVVFRVPSGTRGRHETELFEAPDSAPPRGASRARRRFNHPVACSACAHVRRATGSAGLDPGFFAPFVDAFAGRDGYELLLSVGAAVDSFGPVPENVTVRRSVPQVAVLAHTDVFITHAGANSMHEGLFHGVPLVCSPHFGDQPQNAARVAAEGAGVVLPLGELSATRVASEVERVCGGSFRANAARLGERLRAGGGLGRALDVIESRGP